MLLIPQNDEKCNSKEKHLKMGFQLKFFRYKLICGESVGVNRSLGYCKIKSEKDPLREVIVWQLYFDGISIVEKNSWLYYDGILSYPSLLRDRCCIALHWLPTDTFNGLKKSGYPVSIKNFSQLWKFETTLFLEIFICFGRINSFSQHFSTSLNRCLR